MASEGGEHGGGLSEYISHHLRHLASDKQMAIFDPSIFHLDTITFSLLCGFIVLVVLRVAASRAHAGVPGKFQAAVELLVEFVHEQAKGMVHGKLDFIAPLALTVFLWVTMMNAIDLLPVDWVPWFAEHVLKLENFRPLPTADLNGTLGMALAVLLLVFYYNIKIKGLGGFALQWVTAPFGMPKITANPFTWIAALAAGIVNVGFTIIEYVSNTFSHAMRLFGNMYAGELIFFLIAGLGGSMTLFGIGMHIFAGTAWATFHILIVLLQAYIFMMLTLAYIGQAHEHH